MRGRSSCPSSPFVGQDGSVAEQQLDGGRANAGKVVRVGQYVLRPSNTHTGSILAFLRGVRHGGFKSASVPVGIDEDGASASPSSKATFR